MTDAQEMLTVALPEITGFSDGVELSYTQISSSDPIISLLLANVLPDVKVQDLTLQMPRHIRMERKLYQQEKLLLQ